jgi:hypothetical protein
MLPDGRMELLRPTGLMLDDSQILVRNRARIGSLALRHRLPTIGAHTDYAEAGLLMTYAPNLKALHRRRASLVDRILRGATFSVSSSIEGNACT